MNCQTAESMVNRYIEHDLSVDELENFLEHVENCPSCYDELETYFIVHAAMQQLDEESRDSTLDLRELLEEDIRRSKHYILKMRFRRALSGMGFCALIAGLGGFLIYILLIDGHSILNRAFYGLPDLTNSEGLHTGAVYGFLNILFKVLGEEKPEYLAVAFDRSEPTFRHAKYPEYKGKRKPMPQELKKQIPLLKEMLEKM